MEIGEPGGHAPIHSSLARRAAAEPRENLSRRAPPVSQRLTALRAAEPRDDASSISSHLLARRAGAPRPNPGLERPGYIQSAATRRLEFGHFRGFAARWAVSLRLGGRRYAANGYPVPDGYPLIG